ncbi:MFS general substrate transporter [Hesseltinella vesiculosa]|uniref:MFS general substrate transporter n=1 Tax=Hesseltinella vesiculosa TaxID=101127 RepID=A0A1X2GDK1_9FUNG|nr:MFS general substrate transporter [Hesseltinella vesiculosa]
MAEVTSTAPLESLDNRGFSRHHLKAIFVSGVGFLADQYDLQSINILTTILGYVYYPATGALPTVPQSLLSAAATVGAIIGQVLFGILADKYGRKRMYGIELMIIIVGTIGASLASNTPGGVSVAAILCFWRLFQGIGIGADYPMSATIAAEFSNQSRRGIMLASVFSMQGFGTVSAYIVAIIFLYIFQDTINTDANALDHVWRIVVAFGIVPCIAALYYRLTIPESPRYTLKVLHDKEAAQKDMDAFFNEGGLNTVIRDDDVKYAVHRDESKATWSEFKAYFSKPENFKLLFGTCANWFLIDIAMYGLSLNQSTIIGKIGYGTGATPFDKLSNLIIGNIIIVLAGNLPGYWLSIALIEVIGRRGLQLLGFVMLTIIYVILSAGYHAILDASVGAFVFLYALGYLFINCGPNTTTFIIPVEVYPTRFRATAHGISAACGKVGAAISSFGFSYAVKSSIGVQGNIKTNNQHDGCMLTCTLGILAGCMFLGAVCTFFCTPETKGLKLAEDDQDEFGNTAQETVTVEAKEL